MDDPFVEQHTSNFMFHDKPKNKTRYGNENIIPSASKLQGTGGVDIEMETKNDIEANEEFASFLPPVRKSKNQQLKEQQEQEQQAFQYERQQQQQHQQQQQQQQQQLSHPKTKIKKEQYQKKSVSPLASILKSSKNVLNPLNSNTTKTEYETFVTFILPLIFFLQLLILFRIYFKKN